MTTLIGANVTQTLTEAEYAASGKGFGLGDRYTDSAGREYVYVHASGAITAAGYVCVIDEAYEAAMLSTSNDTYGSLVGVPRAAFADNDYGWVQVYGPSTVYAAANVAADARLMTTATAGQLEDTATGVSVHGVALTAATSGSAAVVAAHLNYPMVDETVA